MIIRENYLQKIRPFYEMCIRDRDTATPNDTDLCKMLIIKKLPTIITTILTICSII